MLRVVLLGLTAALGGACSFDTGGQSAGPDTPDASTARIDAGVDPDAAAGAFDASGLDAAIGPQLVEHIDVPVQNAPIVASNTTLTTGTTYELRASGTVVLSDAQNLSADAEYWWQDTSPGTTADSASFGDTTIDVGLAINDTVVDGTTNPAWGPFAATHIYSFLYVGEGTTITAQFHDLNAANNSGTLSLDIYTAPE
ncbi:MAG TPA: hypothetical protein VMZ28_02755 [Kofleriaceae bacterium]|nr:hypothetical protein [Kofleriaceae bacterium]